MPQYNRDMMHCAQDQCSKKDQCYRYWLGQEIKNTDYQYITFYNPEKSVADGCIYFVKSEYFE